jgi:hypothetical protein
MKATQKRASDKERQRRGSRGVDEVTVTTIRVPNAIMERVEAVIEAEDIQLSKNVWFLLAIKEKLESDEERQRRQGR